MFSTPIRFLRGTDRVEVTRGAWTTIQRDFPTCDLLLVAETTGVYWSTDDEPPAAFATEARFLPRDKGLIVRLFAGEKFHYYLPAGGSLRISRVEVLEGGDANPRHSR